MNEQDEDYGTEPLLPEWLTRHIHRGWLVVILGFFLLAVVTRLQDGFYDGWQWGLRRDSDWFPRELEFYVLAGVTLALAPLIGYAVDRRGSLVIVMPMLIGSAIVFAASEFLEETWLLFLSWLLTMGVIGGVLLIAFAKSVTARFKQHRAKALAVLLAGVMLAPLVPMFRFQIHRVFYWLLPFDFTRGVWPDVREPHALVLIDVSVMLALGIIPAYLFLKHHPSDDSSGRREGLLDTEDVAEVDEQSSNAGSIPEPAAPLRSILLSRSYLLVLAACALQASTLFVLPSAIGIGFTMAHLAYAPVHNSLSMWPMDFPRMGIMLPGAAALFLTGVLADRLGSRKAILVGISLQLVFFLAAAIPIDGWSEVCFGIVAGTGVGALSAATLSLLSEYWGLKYFGLSLGLLASATLIGALIGAQLLPPSMYERDPLIPFIVLPLVILLLLAIALVLILLIKRPQYGNATAGSEPQVAV
ncbi:MAG: hypothetical protein OXC55_04250 [Chloroflexi bacterium]|nr:hypothetical protein [Chloroflexota bacterium]